jgi:hypothetical protein
LLSARGGGNIRRKDGVTSSDPKEDRIGGMNYLIKTFKSALEI